MKWKVKTFNELTRDELYAIYKARVQTFVVEQNRPYQEVDDVDPRALHIWAEEDGQLLAYARVFHGEDHTSFGRVLTTPAARGKGLGKKLIDKVLEEIDEHFNHPVVQIDSQEDKEGFYAKFGFKSVGDVYTFHHTPHIKMILSK
ncbi:GNAT family N-acetyltransferase [Apilactobacillus bombintestini]|uniref:GNAT family N-acetyltransferase n=1 Tax=Apilactobacillus bombintestini TaxID=2419772 RepID=A0A387ASP8_9LACO|nr:GNAT family N-acetyltransferase [Apilactobacillus bombintestini]AYF92993.1 GNAT family N-acetyltransferase [Apilactobacillus bombintestini]